MAIKAANGDLTVSEAGKKGGDKIKEKYGPDHYSRIGSIGGRSTNRRPKKVAREPGQPEPTIQEIAHIAGQRRKEQLSPEEYRDMGKAGGQTTKDRHGAAHYSTIGKKGGQSLLQKYGPDYFKKMSERSRQARADRRDREASG